MAAADKGVRLLVYLIGLAVVLAGIFVLFTQTQLAEWIPIGVTVSVILLILGIAVMAMSDRLTSSSVVYTDHVGYVPPPPPAPRYSTSYERQVHYEDDRPRDPL